MGSFTLRIPPTFPASIRSTPRAGARATRKTESESIAEDSIIRVWRLLALRGADSLMFLSDARRVRTAVSKVRDVVSAKADANRLRVRRNQSVCKRQCWRDRHHDPPQRQTMEVPSPATSAHPNEPPLSGWD